MRAEQERADRKAEVREAAASWQRAGWIDEATRIRIDEYYPDDRTRAGVAFQIVFFVLTLCAFQGGLGLLYALTGSAAGIGTFALLTGLVCVFITEYLLGPMKRRQTGIEAAVSVIAVVQLMIAGAVLVNSASLSFESSLAISLLSFGVLAMAAAWRWGYWIYAALASVFLFAAAARLPWGRLLWILAPVALYKPLLAGCDTSRLPPALRKCSAAMLATCLVALYFAVNIYSLDQKAVELAFWTGNSARFVLPRWLSVLLTACVPPAVLVLGIRARRRLLLNLGLGLIVGSLVTLRCYAHVAPLWMVLSAAGAAMFGVSALLRRYLNSGHGKERGGFTAEPLLENAGNRRTLEMLASVATFTPQARAMPSKPGFEGGGGEFGGGGASGNF